MFGAFEWASCNEIHMYSFSRLVLLGIHSCENHPEKPEGVRLI